MDATGARIRVGISSCLLGAAVRYDGGHKRDAWITGTLARGFEFVPVCPEVAIGLGTPRPPMRLVHTDEIAAAALAASLAPRDGDGVDPAVLAAAAIADTIRRSRRRAREADSGIDVGGCPGDRGHSGSIRAGCVSAVARTRAA